jgi:flagellar hook protein FlgE
MFGAIYVGMAGMNAYSKGLDVISNNVANLNTVGFKAGVASFAEVVYRNSSGATRGSAGPGMTGAGVRVSAEQQDFTQGEKRESNNPLDVALQGNGFFVFERDGQRYYSRAGEFDFDKDGFFVDKISGARVMVSTPTMSLGSLQIDPYRVSPPKATTEVKLSGALARTGSAVAPQTTVIVFDSSGAKHTLKLNFVRADNPQPDPAPTDPSDDPETDPTDPTEETPEETPADPPAVPLNLTWKVEVLDENDHVLGSGTLVFDADGTPSLENTVITATVKPDNVAEFTFALNFGEAGTYSGVTSLLSATGSSLSVLKQDGHDMGTLAAMLFDERGNLELTWSNQEKQKIGRLVLARFDAVGDLTSVGQRMYVTQPGREPQLGGAMDFGLGSISGSRLEMSNVDLTQQFADLIIIQRGYQASSQMTSVANEMMQQLLSMQAK